MFDQNATQDQVFDLVAKGVTDKCVKNLADWLHLLAIAAVWKVTMEQSLHMDRSESENPLA